MEYLGKEQYNNEAHQMFGIQDLTMQTIAQISDLIFTGKCVGLQLSLMGI